MNSSEAPPDDVPPAAAAANATARSIPVYLLNQPVQCAVIALIIVLAAGVNALVIHNICSNELKLRSVNFLIMRNLCVVDLLGALLILPVPLAVTAKGAWDLDEAFCTGNSIVNVAIWFQHIAMFACLKVDRALASCLPIGRYPLLSVEAVNVAIVGSWILAVGVAGTVGMVYTSEYEPAVVLCIPDLPVGFFIAIFR